MNKNSLVVMAISILLAGSWLSGCGASILGFGTGVVWTGEEKAALENLWIGSLEPLPPDPTNWVADDLNAARLGQKLFFDPRFSSNGAISCSTCHLPAKLFQDGKKLADGVGRTNRRTMTIVGVAYSPWLFWDGRKDSLWSQATGPMESAVEHGGNRTFYAHLIAEHYREEYQAIFGELPDLSQLPLNAGPVEDAQARATWDAMTDTDRQAVSLIYANMGKAIEAYERKIMPGPSRFDRYVQAILENDGRTARETLTPDEEAGLKLFIGKAECTRCHNGPLFTNNDFHNTGVPAVPGLPEDSGRMAGAKQVLADEYNCLGIYSDTGEDDCAELSYMLAEGEELMRQYKPPSLRNVAERAPYMHAGQFDTLEDVLRHYNQALPAPAGHSELEPLELSQAEIEQIIAFLKSLSGPLNAAPEWLTYPEATRSIGIGP